ncbi:gliding motility-associated C-terminal domain-containing protein [Bacteroidota bacterium]
MINSYTAVDSIFPSKDTIEVVNPAAFSANDTVMIYQAKGAEPVTITNPNPYNFGNVREADINEAGKYEIILVQKVEGNNIIFKAALNNDYDTDDLVQMIRVPSFKSATVDEELTCEVWNDSIGGLLALMVSDTLFLNADINVAGKGFRGALPFESNGECASTDSATYGSQYFNENTDAIGAGYKGEGVAIYDTTYSKGLGRWANGGGGGNARFSGGGGGGNSGNGGYGGEEDTVTCVTPAFEDSPDYDGYWNSLGGSDGFGLGKQFLVNDSTIFLGGGGGSGTYAGVETASIGGDGGGIVIIIARVIKSTNGNIIAGGESVSGVVSASGAGGGAGGSVVFDIETVVGSNLTVSTKGGEGGWVELYGHSGPGGGGGGGPVLWNTTRPGNVTLESSGGKPGNSQDRAPELFPHEAKSGSVGTETINIKVPLTGFLFNSITSNQEVCMDGVPDLIVGTEPRGGNGTYTFQWQENIDGTSDWSDIVGATSKDYQPPALTDTIYYQRIVTSGSVIDKGNEVEINVLDLIDQNNISGADLVECIGNEAEMILGDTASFGGNTISYEYIWEYSFNSSDWITETGTEDTIYYHGIVSDTTYVRRIVVSGACYDTVAVPIEIIGLPQISNNVMPADQEICEGQIPDDIVGGEPVDGLGLGTYSYYWEEKTESSGWIVVTDSVRNDLAPGNLLETTYYRRTVQSDDCFDISDTITVNVLPPIANDNIVTPSLIYTCYNTAPILIDGSTPTGGAESYTYQWQQSDDGISFTNIATNATSEDYQPGALTDTIFYRRLVSSGQNDCCTSISDTLEVNIHLLPVANILDVIDTTCSGEEVVLDFTITSGQTPYTLTYNDGEADFTQAAINVENYLHAINPETTLESKVYDYTVVSVVDANSCQATDMSGLTKIIVYGEPSADAGVDDEVCQLSYQLSATKSFNNTTGIWTQILNDEIIDIVGDNTNSNLNVTVADADVYTYRWEETNWRQCNDFDTVTITMYENIRNIKITKPDTIFTQGIDSIIYDGMELEVVGYYENDDFESVIEEMWTTNNNAIQVNPSTQSAVFSWTENDIIENFEIQWFVDKGECSDTTFTLNFEVRDYVFVPNGFTPNGDGVNDNFVIDGLNDLDVNKLIIYNRWGTEVKSFDDFSNDIGWDGKEYKN